MRNSFAPLHVFIFLLSLTFYLVVIRTTDHFTHALNINDALSHESSPAENPHVQPRKATWNEKNDEYVSAHRDCWKSKMLDVMMKDKHVGQMHPDDGEDFEESVSVDRVLIGTWEIVKHMSFIHQIASEEQNESAILISSSDRLGMHSL